MTTTLARPATQTGDPDVDALIAAEERRRAGALTLIASENHASAAVLAASASVFTDKYSEGYPGRRYYEGQQVVDPLERLAVARARALFGVEHANVQPYSGSPANLAIFTAFLEPGATVLGLSLPMGGHLTHGWKVSVTGKWWRSTSYGVRADTGRVDLDEVREVALRERPGLIFCGGTALPRAVDFAGFASIAREVGAVLAADISHFAGLVAGGAHPSPVGHADVVMTTTHKTLRGPRGAMILTSADRAAAVDRAVFPGLQGGPHVATTAAIAVALGEAALPSFADYARQVVRNAAVLADELAARGQSLVSGGTDTHLLLLDLGPHGVSGKRAAVALDEAGLTANANAVPFDPRPPMDPSGLRLGTGAVTTRGLREPEMAVLAGLLDDGIRAAARGDDAALARVRTRATALAEAFPPPPPLTVS